MPNRRILFARVPTGLPVAEDFSADEVPLPVPGDGEFLSQTCWLSLDPYYRNIMAGRLCRDILAVPRWRVA